MHTVVIVFKSTAIEGSVTMPALLEINLLQIIERTKNTVAYMKSTFSNVRQAPTENKPSLESNR
jgi:hypothetical protein